MESECGTMSKFTYEIITSESPLGESQVIKRSDGAFIPMDEGNSDYQAYLRHLAGEDEGGTL